MAYDEEMKILCVGPLKTYLSSSPNDTLEYNKLAVVFSIGQQKVVALESLHFTFFI